MSRPPFPNDADRDVLHRLQDRLARGAIRRGNVKRVYPDGSTWWIRPDEQTPAERAQSFHNWPLKDQLRAHCHDFVDWLFR